MNPLEMMDTETLQDPRAEGQAEARGTTPDAGSPTEAPGHGAPTDGAAAPAVPPPPTCLEDTGLSEEFVSGLVLKALYVRGAQLGFDLSDMLALPMGLLDEIIRQLQERRFVEVHSTRGPSRGEYIFALTSQGRGRAAEELEISRYVGPAPVPFATYVRWVERQALDDVHVTEPELRTALRGMTVPEPMLDLLGPAINSGRSLFLFGHPGNGKTLLSERIARLFGETYYVPFAVLVDGSVMIVHDPVHHGGEEPGVGTDGAGPDADGAGTAEGTAVNGNGAGWGAGSGAPIVRALPRHDRRFAEARRPVVVTGGELTLDQLDLQWDASGRMYQAPPQLKAAGGVLVVDDLGRQRVPVADLLNRWVVPLEQRRDHLTLRSGRTIVVPFDSFVIFSTNLEPEELGDEAFLRRIHYKIEVESPDRDEFTDIFRACCEARDISFREDAVAWLFDHHYGDGGVEPRRCHPRDVLDHLVHLAGYRDTTAELSPELFEPACRSYFLPTER